MAVVLFDLTKISVEVWENIINDIYTIHNTYNDIDEHINEWFYNKYGAASGGVGYDSNNRFVKFPNEEKYMEFYLTWL